MQRVRPESVLDIGSQQFGMLLLMIQTQDKTLLRLDWHPGFEKPLDPCFHMLAILKNASSPGRENDALSFFSGWSETEL